MKSILCTLILFILSINNTILAQASTAIEPLEETLLWKVTGHGLKTSYLFGTLHLISEDDFIWTENMQEAFDASKELILEVDISQISTYANNLQRLAPMRDGSSLNTLLSEEDYKYIYHFFEQRPEHQSLFNMSQTWCPFVHISLLYTDILSTPVKRYKSELIKKAKAKDKTIRGLSDHKTYFELLHQHPYQEQADKLVVLIKDLQNDRKIIQNARPLLNAYQAQQVDKFYALIQKRNIGNIDFNSFPIEYNETWLPKIIAQSKKTSSFYAIGVKHLGGPNGLIRLLRNKGYKVTPVL